jgi:hypothetical protein
MSERGAPVERPVLTKDDLVQMLIRAQLENDLEALTRTQNALTTLESNSKALVPADQAPGKSKTQVEAEHATTIFNKITELNAAYLNGVAVSMAASGILGVTLNTFLTQAPHNFLTAGAIAVAAMLGSGVLKLLANRQLRRLQPMP